MKLKKFVPALMSFGLLFGLLGCEEETSSIGSGIASGEVEIALDTFFIDLNAKSLRIENFDSKTGNLMIGSLFSEDYGSLECAFVTRLMCASDLQIADSLLLPERVDSCKLIMAAARNEISGDSLSPQKLSVYMLTQQLPSSLDNTFNPEGLYNPESPLGSLSYTVSNIANTDSMFYKGTYVELNVDLPKEFGVEIFERYKNTPEIFQWPQSLAKEFIPGLYIKPSFGNGCVANIEDLFIAVFYHTKEVTTTVNNGDTITKLTNVRKSVLPFSISPEVLSSNSIRYQPSEKINYLNSLNNGECVITTPGGYIAEFNFPIQPIIDRYKENNIHLSTVNDLALFIPAEAVYSESGLSTVSNILLIKKSEYDTFFKENRIPDNKIAFTGVYDTNKKRYSFTSLRQYFIDLLSKETITEEDTDFVIVPVEITTETNTGYYGSSTTYVTKCSPYIVRPTMTMLKTGEAMLTFSFSTQMIE